ncbi:MAG TPA: FHA domain-containing protein [Burkholderiales bacterium]|nr:FHA domain-containing protein [Burkholderiales bacterium]
MAKLILSLDGQVIKEFTLNKERSTIGRKPHNDIQIDNLAVSGEHAVIMTILNDSFLEDLGSTNGTLVNGQPVKKHFLQDNDVVEIGKYKLKYVNEVPATMSQAEFEKTMVLRAPAAGSKAEAKSLTDSQKIVQAAVKLSDTVINAAPAAAEVSRSASVPAPLPDPAAAEVPKSVSASAPSPGPPAPARAATAMAGGQGTIQILSGPNAGKELPLLKPLTTLGKPGVQVAVIAKRPQGHYITHVEGANFPVVNGRVLDAQAHQLNDHDIIELAGVKMEFFLRS